MKNKKWRHALLALFLGASSIIHTFEDDFDIFDIDNIDLMDTIENTDWVDKIITRAGDIGDIIDILTDPPEVFQLLKERLFKKSFPLNDISLLDLPLLMPDWYCACPSVKGINIFWNQTTRASFADDSTSISSYIDLENDSIVARLDEAINIFAPGTDLDITSIFPLFKNFTVQQRRFGLMYTYGNNFNSWRFEFHLPFYYLERNFFATDEERKTLEERFGALSEEEQEKFQSKHLISDKLGFGDTRFTLSHNVTEGNCYTVLFGAQATIPTAFALIKGLRGSSFENKKKTRISDQEITKIATPALCSFPPTKENKAEALAEAEKLGLEILDHLAANLLEAEMGNNRHVGFGIFVRSKSILSTFIKKDWAHHIHFDSWISLEYLFPSYEKRFYIKKPDLAGFDAVDITDEVATLAFFEQALVDQMFPYVFATSVQPGVIFRWTSKAFIPCGCWKVMLGSDFYLQTTESLSSIKLPTGFVLTDFAVDDAVKKLAFQSRLFGTLSYAFTRNRRSWNIALSAGATTWNSGIGDNFTMSLDIETYF